MSNSWSYRGGTIRYRGGASSGVNIEVHRTGNPPNTFCATPDGYDSHAWLGSLVQGRLIAMGKNFVVTTFSGGQGACQALNVRVPDLRHIDYILHIQFRMDPLVCAQPVYQAVNKKITGNVVGMTIFGAGFATGTTLMAEVIAVGS